MRVHQRQVTLSCVLRVYMRRNVAWSWVRPSQVDLKMRQVNYTGRVRAGFRHPGSEAGPGRAWLTGYNAVSWINKFFFNFNSRSSAIIFAAVDSGLPARHGSRTVATDGADQLGRRARTCSPRRRLPSPPPPCRQSYCPCKPPRCCNTRRGKFDAIHAHDRTDRRLLLRIHKCNPVRNNISARDRYYRCCYYFDFLTHFSDRRATYRPEPVATVYTVNGSKSVVHFRHH